MISKVIAGIAGAMVFTSALFVDSVSNTPIGIMIAGIALLAVSVAADPEVFR